jgi:Protein of unknown function (DUF3467)
MADKSEEQAAAATGMIGPPAVHASRFAFFHTAADVAVSFATIRTVVNQTTGMPGDAGLEWFTTVVMSPTLAEQMHDALGVVIKDYEDQFGKIPKDPKFSVTTERGK